MLSRARTRLDRARRPFPLDALRSIIAVAKGDATREEEARGRARVTHVLYPHLREHVAMLFIANTDDGNLRKAVLELPEAA